MSVIWQGHICEICEELHSIGLDLSENSLAETMTAEGDQNQAAG